MDEKHHPATVKVSVLSEYASYEKYFQSGCSVDLFLRRIILIFSLIIGTNYIIFHTYIIYSFIRL